MELISYVKNLSARVPLLIRYFLLKAVAMYLSWCGTYRLFKESRLIDSFFTDLLASPVFYLLKLVYQNHEVELLSDTEYPVIHVDDITNLTILDGCNGLELYVLYAGIIFCFPKVKINTALAWIAGGIAGIFVLNMLRCVAISYLQYADFYYLDFVHHYVFTIAVYSFIIGLWTTCLKRNLAVSAK